MTPALPLPGVASLARSPRRLLARLLPVALLALPLSATANPAANDLPVEEIQTFAEVFERIKRAYVEEVDDATLLRNAMRGLLSELDPHSAYLDREEFQSLRESTQGEFGGIGIEVRSEERRVGQGCRSRRSQDTAQTQP